MSVALIKVRQTLKYSYAHLNSYFSGKDVIKVLDITQLHVEHSRLERNVRATNQGILCREWKARYGRAPFHTNTPETYPLSSNILFVCVTGCP